MPDIVESVELHEKGEEHSPNPHDYDLVQSRIIEPLTVSVAEATITDEATVSILPKSISRG